jgi:Leucine-rich repeat (LRR) protein
MIRILKISLLLVILFHKFNEQIHLNKTSLATICACNPLQLTSIDLNSKNIKTIHPATFTGLTSLGWLGMNNNQISSIHPATFTGLTSLYRLLLQNNKINQIEEELFKGLKNLGQFF